jgi:hypothetical protein
VVVSLLEEREMEVNSVLKKMVVGFSLEEEMIYLLLEEMVEVEKEQEVVVSLLLEEEMVVNSVLKEILVGLFLEEEMISLLLEEMVEVEQGKEMVEE